MRASLRLSLLCICLFMTHQVLAQPLAFDLEEGGERFNSNQNAFERLKDEAESKEISILPVSLALGLFLSALLLRKAN